MILYYAKDINIEFTNQAVVHQRLNLGCGKKILNGWMNADIQKGKDIDISFDFDKFPYPLKSNTFDYVLVDNVLEHLCDPAKVLDELHRICKKDSIVRIIVPYYNCKGAYNDLTHKHVFNETAFDVLVNGHNHYVYDKKQKFKIKKLDLLPTRLGKLIYPKKLRWAVSLVLGEIIYAIDIELVACK